MFELAAIGVPIAVIGIIFMIVASPRLMPSSLNPICQLKDLDNRSYMAELEIPRGSRLVGKDPAIVFTYKYPALDVLELIRYSHIFHPTRDEMEIAAGDLLLVKGSLNDLVGVLNNEDVKLPRSERGLSFGVGKDEPIVTELLISPQSRLLGQRLLETNLMRDSEINVIAIKRSNLHFTERQVHDVRLRVGDIILVWLNSHKMDAIRAEREFIINEDVAEDIIHKRKAWLALSIFFGLVVAATLGLAKIMTCALTAVFLLLVTGCLQMRDAYRSLQGDVLLLIVGTIALGTAMQKTGVSQIYAEGFLSLFKGYTPQIVLGGVILMTSISTQILSNNATAVLIFPIAVSAALGLGINPKPFIIGVCFGASACFATPMGYQTNLLVLGPGGYRFSDYLKMGIPLNLLVLIAGTLFIPLFWPFGT
jgi:di/tricarboxylate transporter